MDKVWRYEWTDSSLIADWQPLDETGHPDSGKKLWTWGFHATDPEGFTLFHINPARSSAVLKEFLGEIFAGVERVKREVLTVARRPPRRNEAQNIADRFRKHDDHYFQFLKTDGIEPTNNAMEKRFRFVVIDRIITQGTRGEAGRLRCARI